MTPVKAAVAVALSSFLSLGVHAQSISRVRLPTELIPYSKPGTLLGLDRTMLRDLDNAPPGNRTTDAGATLGRVLFYDKRLSRNQRVSCASCHKQRNAFADPRAASLGFRGRRTARNSMSLSNLAYYKNGRYFWDERGATLEKMVLMPIQDQIEMGMNLEDLVERLSGDTGYLWLFREAYGSSEITVDGIARGLAQFLRSMVSFKSKFDEGLVQTRSIAVDFPNFSASENLGKRVFLGLHETRNRVSCASCHMQDPSVQLDKRMTVAGAVPVLFQGVEATNNGIDSGKEGDDRGLWETTSWRGDMGKFKAPSLRNIALTAPYMHDGRFRTLERVIQHYSQGINRHENLDARLNPRSSGWGHVEARNFGFQFTRRESVALLMFLRTLTDKQFVRDPRFSDPF